MPKTKPQKISSPIPLAGFIIWWQAIVHPTLHAFHLTGGGMLDGADLKGGMLAGKAHPRKSSSQAMLC